MAIQITGRLTFPGGVHPPDNKELTKNSAIEPGPAPREVAVLMSQHIGAICKPLVAKKDKVVLGQKVGDCEAFVAAPVHSPVNGTVKDVTLQTHPVLGRAMAVVIEADPDNIAKTPVADSFKPDFSPDAYDNEAIMNAVRSSGIVGMGGAGFPSRVKLQPNKDYPIKDFILNCCECEPFITCDYRMMLEWTSQVLAGVALMNKVTASPKIYIAIEDNKPEAIAVMNQAAEKSPLRDKMRVVAVKTKYPQGGERQLIKALLGKDVPTGGIPPMVNALVTNVATAAAVAEAVVLGSPLTHRVVTVSGHGINRRGNFYVADGTSVGDLVEFCGGLREDAVKVVLGGPMMGFAIADMSTPLTKTSGALTVLTPSEISKAKFDGHKSSCIRCGRCIEVCPVNINPTRIAHAVMHQKMDLAKSYFMSACIECGCCSYVCPANIELTGYIKTGKMLDARAKKNIPV